MLCGLPYRAIAPITLTEQYLLRDINWVFKPSKLFCPPGRHPLYFRFVYKHLKFYSDSKILDNVAYFTGSH